VVRRNANGHELKKRAHPFRLELPAPPGGWGRRDADLRAAADRASGGAWYMWSPSRRDPPVTVFGFATEAACAAFAELIRKMRIDV
jgi:hypothetical protein